MYKLGQRGAIQFIVLLILLAGIAGVVYLVTSGPLKIFPKASVSGPIGPQTGFLLSPLTNTYVVGAEVPVKILIRSDVSAANLFESKLKFDKDLLSVDRIDTSNTVVANWVEQYSDNNTGEISLVGGVPTPGFQSNTSGGPALMAVVYFKALKAGNAKITFTDSAAIYSNADNINILTVKDSLSLSITSEEYTPTPVPTIVPTPIATSVPTPVVTPQPGTGDGNEDGRVNLADMSVLLSDFNKTSGYRLSIDLNGDGKINTFDFSLLRNLLIANKVIRG